MARSNDFSTSNSYIVYWIEIIQNSQNVASNTSNVTVRVWVKRTNAGYTTYGSGTVYVYINGSTYTNSITTAHKITSTPIKIFEKTMNIGHNADGTKRLDTSAYITHSQFSSNSHAFSMNLTTIPRASQPTGSDTDNWYWYGEKITIYTNRKSNSFTHTLRYNWNGRTGTIATGVGTYYTWTIPKDFMNYIPNNDYTMGTIYCDTYNGGTYIGTKSMTIGTSVPHDVKPKLARIVHSEYNQTVKNNIGTYVQGLSRLNLVIQQSDITIAYGSPITNYSITIEGATHNVASTVSNVIKGRGSIPITAKITDARGRSDTITTYITVLPYSPPKISALDVKRANSNGTENPLGTYALIKRDISVSSLKVDEVEKNVLSYAIDVKEKGHDSWTTKVEKTISSGQISLSGTEVIGIFDILKSYDVRLRVSDRFNSTISYELIASGRVTMSWGREGIGIGKIHEYGVLDVNGDSYFTGAMKIDGTIDLTRPIHTLAHDFISMRNGWRAYGGVYTYPAFTKSSDGFVHLRGLVKGGTTGSVIGVLPEGCRPLNVEMFAGIGGDNNRARIDVYPNGEIKLIAGNESFVTLSGIAFRAEN